VTGGVPRPYEAPARPELRVSTASAGADGAVAAILAALR
jgi:adenylylsulfate kinase-like enzyme